MKVKTSELQDAALDWAVNQIEECCDDPVPPPFSTSWAWVGPIIEEQGIALYLYGDSQWNAHVGGRESVGPTPLIAAMRCYVALRIGEEVDVPDDLVWNELIYEKGDE